jgi:hypothetical protein
MVTICKLVRQLEVCSWSFCFKNTRSLIDLMYSHAGRMYH